jgi:hypothetical protein
MSPRTIAKPNAGESYYLALTKFKTNCGGPSLTLESDFSRQ